MERLEYFVTASNHDGNEATAHLELLSPEDRQFYRRTLCLDASDPGKRTMNQLDQMKRDERLLYDDSRADWHAAMPLLATRSVAIVMDELNASAWAASSRDSRRQSVPVLDGEPGVGKSMIAKAFAATEMERLARLAYLRRNDADSTTRRGVASFRPVLYANLEGAMSQIQLFRMLCDLLGWPADRDVSRSLSRAMHECGTKLIVLDEIQFINFDGKTGRHVHNAMKWITDGGVRLVLSGNDIEWVLGDLAGAERESSRRQSRGRWKILTVPRMMYSTAAEKDEWRALLLAFEDRLRLARAGTPGWLHRELADYTWTVTLGYVNSLATLLLDAAGLAAITGTERIDRELLDRVTVEGHPEKGRAGRVQAWDAGEYKFPQAS